MKNLFTLFAVMLVVCSVFTAAQATENSDWEYYTIVDELTDEKTSTAVSIDDDYDVTVVCDQNKNFGVVIAADRFYYAKDSILVKYRVDKQPMVEIQVYWDKPFAIIGVGETAPAINFARAIAAANNRFVFKLEDQSVVVFSVKGSTRTINRVLADCGIE